MQILRFYFVGQILRWGRSTLYGRLSAKDRFSLCFFFFFLNILTDYFTIIYYVFLSIFCIKQTSYNFIAMGRYNMKNFRLDTICNITQEPQEL